jgi:hypothetical protein
MSGEHDTQLSTPRGRGGLRSLWPEWCALCAYAGLVATAIPYHEPWVDEAQAWQLARSLPLGPLFKTYIRYEGSPGLWHFLLWIMARLHVSYGGLHWISGAIATAGASLLIFKSPLPRYLKLSFPFTYFLLFQYAVIARNYVLVPIFFFTLAIWWKKKPLIVALMLGLLANTALHAAVLSGGLAIVYAFDQLRSGSLREPRRRRQLLLCASLLVAFYAFAIWTAWPSHDMGFMRVLGQSRPFFSNAIASLAWAICEPAILSVLFWAILALWLIARRKAQYLLPLLFFAALSGAVFFNWWHAGLLVPFLIFVLWVTWPAPESRTFEFDTASRAALIVMIATQIAWSGYALFFDHYFAYSPDRAAAEFLKPYVQKDAVIVVTSVSDNSSKLIDAFTSAGILPYFDHNIYSNTPYSFWWWSSNDSSEEQFKAMLPSHPRIVLVEVARQRNVSDRDFRNESFASFVREGYQYRRTFCGSMPTRFDIGQTICHVIFEYPAASGSSGG